MEGEVIQAVKCKCQRIVAASVFPVDNDPEWEESIRDFKERGGYEIFTTRGSVLMGRCVCKEKMKELALFIKDEYVRCVNDSDLITEKLDELILLI